MALQYLPLPEEEYPIYMSIFKEAFAPTMWKVMMPNGGTDEDLAHIVADMKRSSQNHPGRATFHKVVDPSLPASDPYHGIIGISQWKLFPRERSEEEMKAEEEYEEKEHEKYGFPPNMDQAPMGDFIGYAKEFKKKHIGRAPYMFLQLLATRPGYGRKGVGAAAMRFGTERADELGLPMYLEASPDGFGLYKRFGFEAVDRMPWDARKYGHRDPNTHFCMKRPAQKKVAS